MSDQEATERLLRDVEGRTIIQPRVIKFRTGRRRLSWSKNVVALGLSSGFLEPLESTSIHLIMTGVTRLIHLFPFGGVTQSFIDQYNDEVRLEVERVRDFIILHYHVTEREEPFWRECRTMSIPESLARRVNMFRERAHAWQADGELFRVDSWMQVMLGQGIQPRNYHHLTKAMSQQDLARFLGGLRASIGRTIERLPTHQQFVDEYCRTSSDVWEMARAKTNA
jgi:tryptophan halogenase